MNAPTVKRRLVAYLCGFDPQGPAHYHQLYRDEAAKQAAVSGDELTVGKRRKVSDIVAAWEVVWRRDDAETRTQYEYFRWDDIVREHWPRSRWGLYRATVYATWTMWRNGVMWHAWRRSWPMFTAIAWPGVLVIGFALAGLGLSLATVLLMWSGQAMFAALLALVGAPALVAAARRAEARSHMAWLMRSLASLARQGRRQTPSLDDRLLALGRHLAERWGQGEFDEVLVVGHSSGAMMAQLVLDHALAVAPPPPSTTLSLLTLGHCGPLLSRPEEALHYRQALGRLASQPRLDWIDVGAPPDGCCFPLVDPTECLDDRDAPKRPKLLNPKFAQLFSPQSYPAVKQDKFRCHFQYLMAGELRGAYDYFAITAGPITLATRFSAQPSVSNFRQFTCFGGPRR